MTANRFNDINNASAPFSYVKEKVSARKNTRCHLTNEMIEKGTNMYHFKLFNLDADVDFYAEKNAFENSDYYINYKDHYLKNNYMISVFNNYDYFRSSKYSDAINEFSFDKALELVTNPDVTTKKDKVNSDLTTFLSILVKCGFSDRLLSVLDTIPKCSLPLFALLDDNRFQNKVAEITKTPQLKKALDIIRKKKLTLQDFNFLIEFSSKNLNFIELFASTLKKYSLHYLYSRQTGDSFGKLNPINHCRLVYFFIMQPELLPLYNDYLTTTKLPIKNGSIYMECYYYRASLFYVAKNHPDLIESWITAMPLRIEFYYSGSPKAFVNESIKMIKYQLINQN